MTNRKVNQLLLSFLIPLFCISCTKKAEEAVAASLTNTQREVNCSAISSYTRPAYTKDASARTIPYKITAKMYHSVSDTVVDTPQMVIDKIQKSFQLWESIPEANVKFTYAGLAGNYYASYDDVPRDGTIYIVLNNDHEIIFAQTGDAGYAGYDGSIPTTYNGGWVFIDTKANLANVTLPVIAHEIGHAIGLIHSVAPDSLMNCSQTAFNANDTLGFNLQDRVNLIAKWPAPGVVAYSISGRASSAFVQSQMVVFAVNVENGETYHDEVEDAFGSYVINISRPGVYRVFAVNDPRQMYASNKVSSWYLADGTSTTDPYAGASLELTTTTPTVSGIDFQTIDAAPAFNIFDWAMGDTSWVTYNLFKPTLLRPGTSGDFQIASYGHFGIEWVESYGEKPDYQFTFNRPEGFAPMVTVSACAGAPQGSRLLIAKGGSTVMAGLVGVNVIGADLPDVIAAPPLDARDPSLPAEQNIYDNQFSVNYDFTVFDQNYWKN